MTTTKQGTSFRLSPEAKKLLAKLAEVQGISQTSVLEVLIRREARRVIQDAR